MKHKATKLLSFLLALVMLAGLLPIGQVAYAADSVPINEENFPDAVFRAYVQANFDKSGSSGSPDGALDESELAAVTHIDVTSKGIATLKGVEHFVNLTHLYCSRNKLQFLDLWQNTKLEVVSCFENELEGLTLGSSTALTTLYCSENQLTVLNVSGAPNLTILSCYGNPLTALDVSAVPALDRAVRKGTKTVDGDVAEYRDGDILLRVDKTLTPTAATPYDLWVGGVEVTSVNKDNILGDGTASYDPATKTLTFNSLTSLPGYYVRNSNEHYGVYATGNLTVAGSASFTISSTSGTNYGVYTTGKLTIADGAALTISVDNDALIGWQGVVIHGGTLNLNGRSGAAINANGGGLTVNGGTVSLKSSVHGIDAQGQMVVVNGGTLTINGGYNGAIRTMSSGSIQVNGGVLDATAPSGKKAVDTSHITWADTHELTEGSLDGDHFRIVPKQAPASYTVTVNSGTADKATAASGETVTLTANTAPSGKTFDKWVVNAGGVSLTDETASTTTFTMPAANVEVAATYKDLPPITYTVTVNSGTADKATAAAGEMVTLTADAAPSGKTFDKWVVNAGGVSLTDETASTTTFTMPAGNVEVTATYKDLPPVTYTVTVNSGTADKTAAAAGETVTLTANTAPSGKTFDKWVVNAGGVSLTDETASTTTFTMPAANVEVTATYKDLPPVTYTVTVNSGTADKTAAAAGEMVTLTANTAPSGKTFDKWVVNAGGVSLTDENASTTTFTMPAENVEVTATYKDLPPVTYTVTFKDGENTLSTATVNGGEKVAKPADPTKTGYTFNGWYADATFTAAFNFDQAITANTTVYAKFTEDSVTPPGPTTYTVTFKDGENTLSTSTVNSGEKVAKPADPTKTDYTFNGWYADSTFNAAFDFNTAITADTTVYAKFTKDSTDPVPVTKYTITYSLNGGKLDGKTGTVTVQVEDGTTITLPKPTKDGYTFDYWEGSKYEAGASYTVTGDHTFTAQWKANSTTEKPGDTDKPGNNGKDTSPKTGDETNLALWLMLMTGSLAGLAGVGVLGRKRRKASK